MHRLLALFVAVALVMGSVSVTVAQAGPPGTFPSTPAPEDCRVEPRPLESVVAVAATPVAATPAVATPAGSFVPLAGTPADEATAAEVIAVLHELFA